MIALASSKLINGIEFPDAFEVIVACQSEVVSLPKGCALCTFAVRLTRRRAIPVDYLFWAILPLKTRVNVL